MNFREFVMTKGSISVNKKLAGKLGMSTAIIYAELLSRYFYFKDRKELTDDGFFFNTVKDLEADTTYKRDTQLKAINVLAELGLLVYEVRDDKYRGSLRYFKLVEDESLFESVIYDKNQGEQSTNKSSNLEDKIEVPDEKIDAVNDLINPNNTINKTKEIRLKNIKTSTKDLSSARTLPTQKTLLPGITSTSKTKPPKQVKPRNQKELALVKVDQARKGEIAYESLTFRDITYYYVEKHNKLFTVPINFDRYTSVTIIRDALLQRYSVDSRGACDFIDSLFQAYLIHPKKWTCLTFNMIKQNHFLMDSLVEDIRSGRTTRNVYIANDFTNHQFSDDTVEVF